MKNTKNEYKKRQFITFHIDNHLLGIDILNIREINKNLDICPVPLSPDYIRGLLNLRGQIMTVFDLGKRLGFESRKITVESKNIILKDEDVALLVDCIRDVIQISEEHVVLPPAGAGEIEEEFVEGIIKLKKELLVIVSADKILNYKISTEVV
ncbi:chemotaxis protein CheW [Candidatus Margulisiibacteriota bacterium]